jgi:hypothetical protein
MPISYSGEELRETERAILRALCQPSTTQALRERILRELASYRWRAQDHRVIFDALQKSRPVRTSSLHEQLRAHATRMGFPDIDWDAFLAPGEESQEIEASVSRLKASIEPV